MTLNVRVQTANMLHSFATRIVGTNLCVDIEKDYKLYNPMAEKKDTKL